MKIKSPQDWWAGWMFIAFGLFFIVFAGHARIRRQNRGATDPLPDGHGRCAWGRAYFPTVLGGMLAVLGGIVLFQSFADGRHADPGSSISGR